MTITKKLMIAAGFIVFLSGCVGSDTSTVVAGTIQENQKFTLKDTKGESVSLDSLLKSNRAVLLNFWATWCPPCREEIPGLINLHKHFKDRSFSVVGIDVGESAERVSSFMEKSGINYPVLLDQKQETTYAYGVLGIPTSLLVASDGTIIGEYHSYTPKLVSDVENALK